MWILGCGDIDLTFSLEFIQFDWATCNVCQIAEPIEFIRFCQPKENAQNGQISFPFFSILNIQWNIDSITSLVFVIYRWPSCKLSTFIILSLISDHPNLILTHIFIIPLRHHENNNNRAFHSAIIGQPCIQISCIDVIFIWCCAWFFSSREYAFTFGWLIWCAWNGMLSSVLWTNRSGAYFFLQMRFYIL